MSAEDRSRDAGDGFGLLRIVAALMVIFAHSLPLAGTPEPLWRSHGFSVGFGSLAVDIFMVISGYLVVASWMRDPIAPRFAVRRVARIWPGLLVMLLVTTLVMGPLVTTLPIGQYLTNFRTIAYLVGSLLLLPVWELPGVFQAQLYHGVNGSLWTLPIEVTAYAGVVIFGPFLVTVGWRRRAARAVLLLTVAGLLALLGPMGGLLRWLAEPFLGFFLVGAVLYLARERLPMTRQRFALALAGACLSGLVGAGLLFIPLVAYAVTFVGTRQKPLWRRISGLGDPSYGIYIYAYPIQQLLVHLQLAPSGWVLFVTASLASITAGYLSWHLVEGPSLRLARRLLQRRQAASRDRVAPAAAA